MTEKLTFIVSGLIKDEADINSIEFWGHDAGEFVAEEERHELIEKTEHKDKVKHVDKTEEKVSTEDKP